GGRLGWEEEAAERNWRRRSRMQMARGREQGAARREIFGGKQGEEGGPRWTWVHLVRAGNFQTGQGSSGWGASGRRGPRAGERLATWIFFYFSFWREGPLSSHLRRSSYLLLQ